MTSTTNSQFSWKLSKSQISQITSGYISLEQKVSLETPAWHISDMCRGAQARGRSQGSPTSQQKWVFGFYGVKLTEIGCVEFELLSGTSYKTKFNQLLSWCQEGPGTQAICSCSAFSGQQKGAGVGDSEVFHSPDRNANIKGRGNRGPPSQTEQILQWVAWRFKPETCISFFSKSN